MQQCLLRIIKKINLQPGLPDAPVQEDPKCD